MTTINPFDFFVEDYAENYPFDYTEHLKNELLPYLETIDCGPKFEKFLAAVDLQERSINDFLVDITQYVQGEIEYLVRLEPGERINSKWSCKAVKTIWDKVKGFKN